MSAGAVELIRSIRDLHPDAVVSATVQPNPDEDETSFSSVTIIGLPADRYPEFRRGEFGDDHILTVRGPDRRDSSATLSVTRYHDDDVVAALQTALDYITAQAGAGQ